MRGPQQRHKSMLIYSSCLVTLLLLGIEGAYPAPQVVVHPAVQSRAIERGMLRAIFSMRMRLWPDGTPIKVFVLEDRDESHRRFVKTKLGVFPYQLRQVWDRLVFSGTGQAPQEVGSSKQMRAHIAITPGAIGYLPEALIDDSVRVLRITR